MGRPAHRLRAGLLLAACLGLLRAARAQIAPAPGGRVGDCQRSEGCAVLVPTYWTVVGNVNFNFTGLEQDGPLDEFQWGVGTAPGQLDAVPFQTIAGSSLRFNAFNFNTLYEQTVYIDGQTFVNQTVSTLNYTLPNQSLLDGKTYYVTVQQSSDVPLVASSTAVKVATGVPQMGERGYIVNTRTCTVADSQRNPTELWACWDSFNTTAAPIVAYYAQAFLQSAGGGPPTPVGPGLAVGLRRTAHLTGLNLQVGSQYAVQVTATNAAGVNGTDFGPPVRILEGGRGLSTVGTTFVVASGIIVLFLCLYLSAYLFFRRRHNSKQAQKQAEREKAKVMKSLMYGLVRSGGDGAADAADALRNARALAFVTTDLQSSTAQAAASPHAFLKVQEIHDTVIREGIAKHRGYEINTEGDAFHIAFGSAADALIFCMETQCRLLETAWPREVLRLPACGEARGRGGELLFRGPRVRMGLHWAAEGTVAHRLHLLTKHRVFSGPGFQVACEVGDAANGGQVLLTHDAWLRLVPDMAAAGFPTVKQIGLFQLQSWPTPVWLYEASQLLGRPLARTHKELRRVEMLETGWGLNIVPPPEPREGGVLTFVAMRLDPPGPPLGRGPALRRGEEGGSIRSTLHAVVGGSPSAPGELPPALARALFEALATAAMQFRGYIHLVRDSQGVFGAAFQQTLDAVRFAHAAQARLLYTAWPSAPRDAHCSPAEFTPDGRLLFHGPRVAMGVHETSDFESEHVALPSAGQRESDVHFFGPGVELAQALARAAHGGQVVLSESAWAAAQDALPGTSQVVSLGTHVVDAALGGPMLLMEVMPAVLGRRSFPPPATQEAIEPGYRDSPDPSQDMALVFTKVSRPAEVLAAEQARGRISDGDIVRALTAFNVGVGKVSRLVRELLHEYGGYECKEPEPGKFTLAFHTLEAAVRWAAVLQKELLELAWPEALLGWPDCAEAHAGGGDGGSNDGGRGPLLWRGLRVRVGMACGRPQYRKPLNTGRADYYGSLPNLAARVAALAHPGQILVEGSSGFAEEVRWFPEDHVAVLGLPDTLARCHDKEEIELQLLGFYLIKDLDDPKPILQATPASLVGREYEPLAAAMRVAVPKRHRSGSHSHGHLVGSFLSMSSGSQPSNTARGGPLSSLARGGSRFFGGVVRDLPHLAGVRRKERSLPQPNRPRASEEAPLGVPDGGRGSPWGSFARTLDQRVQAAAAAPLPHHRSAGAALGGRVPALLEPLSRESSGVSAAVQAGNGSLGAAGLQPLARSRSLSSSSSVHGPPTEAVDAAAHQASPRSPDGRASPCQRSSSLPGRRSVQAQHVELVQLLPDLPSLASSPSALAQQAAAAQELHTRDSGFAAEVAQTFAASRLAWAASSPAAPAATAASAPLPDPPRAPLRRSPTPRGLGAEPGLARHSPAASGAGLSRELLDGARSLEEPVSASAEPASAFAAGPAPALTDAGTPREVAPRTALQLARTGPSLQHGPGPGGRESPDDGGEDPSLRGAERSSGSDRSLGSSSLGGRSGGGQEAAQRLPSGSSQRLSRFTARRNAVLDVAHRRQVAQEGLADGGAHAGSPPRTWSFSAEGGTPPVVPEEAPEPGEQD